MPRRQPSPAKRLSLGQFVLCALMIPGLVHLGIMLGRWIEMHWYLPGRIFQWTLLVLAVAAYVVLIARYDPR